MPSNFKKFQSSKCEERNLLDRTKLCPPCLPDPNAAKINWIMLSEPYFDARTCEYVSIYRIPRKKLLENDFRTLSEIGERFKKESIRHLLRHYNKLENDYTVCAFGGCLTPEEFEEYRDAFNNFYTVMYDNYHQIMSKYQLSSAIANPATGGLLAVIGMFADFSAITAVGAATGPVMILLNFILLKMAEGELEEFFKDQIEDFPIDELRDDLINLIGPDKLEGLSRLVDVYSEIHPYALEWVATIPNDGYIVDDSNHLKFKLTVPAFNFDLIPDASSAEDEDEDEEMENSTSFPDEIIITTKELQEQKNNLLAALKVFNVPYEFFKRIESGRLLYKEGTTYSTFNLDAKANQTKIFFEKLEDFLSKNNYRFPYQFVFNLKARIAEEIKIVFDNSNPKKPLKIKSIFAKSPYCDFEELTIGSLAVYNPTVMNFLINLKEINNKLTCLDKIEWMDFCLDYVYPELKVDYGRNTGAELDEESIIECLGDPGDWAGENILDPLFSFFSTYAFDLEQKVCSGDATPDEANPLSVLDSINRDKIAMDLAKKRKKAIEREEKAKRDEQVKKLQEQGRLESVNTANRNDPNNTVDDSPYAFPENEPTIIIDGEQYYYLEPNANDSTESADAHERLSDSDLDAQVDKRVEEEAAKISENMGQKWHQFYIQQALDSVSIDETWQNFIKSFTKKTDTSSGNWWYDMLNYLGLCGLTNINTAAIQCISKGISLDDLQETLIKNTLKSLPMENWSDLLIGLPPSARSQIEQQMVEDFGESFQPPWASEENTQVIKSPEERRQKIANAAAALKNRYQKALTALEEEAEGVDPIGGESTPDGSSSAKINKMLNKIQKFTDDAQQYVDKPNEKFSQANLKRFSILIDKNIKNDVDKTGTIDLSKSAKLIVDAYVDAIIKYVDNNLVMQQLRQLPGADAIVGILNVLIPDCEGREQKELGQILEGLEPSEGFLETFKVDICNPNLAINKINPPDFRGAPILLDFVGIALKETIDRLIGEFVKILIMETLRLLDAALCKALESIGKIAGNILQGVDTPLEEVFKEVFCPDLNDDQVKDELNKLLDSASPSYVDRSAPGYGNLDLAACLGNALAGTVTKMQLLQVMLNPTQNTSVLQNMADAIAINCPELADIYGAPELLEEFLENLTSALPPETIAALQDIIDPEQDDILSESICFTSEELEIYLRSLESVYRELGIPAEEAAQMGYQNTLNNLNSALDQQSGLDNAMQEALDSSPSDAIQDFLDSLPPGNYSEEEIRAKIEACTDLKNTSDFGGNLFNQPPELVQLENRMTDTLFSQVHEIFLRDLIGSDGAILSRILSDKQGITFSRHSFLSDNFLLGTFYHNTPEAAVENSSLLDILNPLALISNRGFFPETIGISMRNQLLNDITLESPTEAGPNIILQYEASDAASLDYGDSNKIKLYDEIGQNLNYNVEYNARVMNYTKGSLEVEKALNNSELLSLQPFLSNDMGVSYRKRVFDAFILKKLGNFAPYYLSDSELYDTSRTKIFNFVKNIIVGDSSSEVSNGFLFGWQDDPLTKEDYEYVAPDGSPYSFSEEEAILGRSATNNPRVHFLDPSIYGGTYLKPPVYIDPVQFNGWMDVVTKALPSLSNCSDKADNLFRLGEISSHANKVKNSSRMDNRLGQNSSPNCFEEKPFDKILSNAGKAGLAGVVKSMIRTHVVDNILKSLPILMNLKYNEKNYDELFEKMIVTSMRDSIHPVSTFFSKIQKENFYLLFLEQVVVDYQRKIDQGSFIPTSRVEDALEVISAAESNYTRIASTFANLPDGKLFADPITEEYITNFDFENYDRKEFIFYALRYQAKKEKLFTDTEELSTNPNLIRAFVPMEDLLLDCKIFMIRMVRDQCEVILAELIREEFAKTVDFFFKELQPKISDLKLFSLTNKQIFSNTELENIGTTSYDEKVTNLETTSLGDVKDVIGNIEENSPFARTDEHEFIIEKYIRVKDKIGGREQIHEITRRDHRLRDVVSTAGFSDLIESIKEEHPDKFLSEIFGDAELIYSATAKQLLDGGVHISVLNSNNIDLTFEQIIYFNLRGAIPNRDEVAKTFISVNKAIIDLAELDLEPTGYRGEIGVKTGVRICLKMPIGSVDSNYSPTEADLEISRKEKSYYCNHRNAPDSDTYGFPICSAEIEMVDHKLSEFNLDNGPYEFDLDCLLRKLTKSEDFELLFDKILNFKSLPSVLSMYSNLFFIDSIGREDGWDDPDALTPWIGAFADWPTRPDSFFDRTYKVCRKMFASFYYSSEHVNKEAYKDSAQSEQLLANATKDWFKNIFQVKPKMDKLKSPNPFAKSHRLYESKPFDKDGQECDNPYKQIFS